ncbi:MAG: hypothetical protein ABIS01_06040 [Ferruginibacter sp.]
MDWQVTEPCPKAGAKVQNILGELIKQMAEMKNEPELLKKKPSIQKGVEKGQ